MFIKLLVIVGVLVVGQASGASTQPRQEPSTHSPSIMDNRLDILQNIMQKIMVNIMQTMVIMDIMNTPSLPETSTRGVVAPVWPMWPPLNSINLVKDALRKSR